MATVDAIGSGLSGAGAGAAIGSVVPGIGTGIGALTGAGLGLGGSLLSSAFNVSQQRAANRTAIDLANSAHQREVADLKKAGINPILSSRLGGSATPGISAPQGSDPTQSVVQGANSAAQLGLLRAQTFKTTAEGTLAANLANSPEYLKSATDQGVYTRNLTFAQAAKAANEAKFSNKTVDEKIKAELAELASSAAQSRAEGSMHSNWFGQHILPYIESALHGSHILKNMDER